MRPIATAPRGEVWRGVGEGDVSAEAALMSLRPEDVCGILAGRFRDTASLTPLATGTGVRPGDAAGALVLSREVAECLSDDAGGAGSVAYVYADGDADDFPALRNCEAFLTSDPARTSFLVVQALTEGKPTVMGVPCRFVEVGDRHHRVSFRRMGGRSFEVSVPWRAMQLMVDPQRPPVEVVEGSPIAVAGSTGTIYAGSAPTSPSVVGATHDILLECYLAAWQRYGPRDAWSRMRETAVYQRSVERLEDLLRDPMLQGFGKVLALAIERSPLRVFATAHTVEDVVRARLLTAAVRLGHDGSVELPVLSGMQGVGLVRDERMWVTAEQLDLLRLVFLGRRVLGERRWADVETRYRSVHGARLREVLSAASGQPVVVRTLCMPSSKLFAEDFDGAAFATVHGLAAGAVVDAVGRLSAESEPYHGCRGLRLFCIRPDVARLWVATLLRAACEARRDGLSPRLRILLATVTFPEEVEAFLDLYDEVAAEVLGPQDDVVEGISVMLETAGAYIGLEELQAVRGRTARITGALIGSNDFTAACLNLHRGDSPRTLIPGYLEAGLLRGSPFHHLHEPLVGKAILSSLERSRAAEVSLGRGHAAGYLWGFGGELAGDWQTVQWLAEHAAPLGLSYLTTTPDRMPVAMIAAAQSGRRRGR